MKKFLLKVTLFFGLSALAFLGAFGLYWVRLSTMSFAISPEKKIVFLGDSHAEVGIDTAEIPGAYNFAQSGDPYFDQYFRLERLLKDNPQITTVLVTATPHSLARYGDERIFGDFTVSMVVPNALPIYTKKEWMMYLERDGLRLAKFIFSKPMSLAKKALTPSKKAMMVRLGSQQKSERRNLAKSIAHEKDLTATERLHGDDSVGNVRQVEYLRKIVDFTRSQGVRIIFLNLPIYNDDEFFDVPYFEALLKEKFSDVEFWDYADFPIPDNCRQDINHLNCWGAKIFSKELCSRMKKEGILSE